MAKLKTVSDKLPKRMCKEWLERNGFADIKPARGESCDLIGKKNDETYYIEIKYSSKIEGKFFGTVMLTELFQAVNNKENYLFLVCRGHGENIEDWFFKLFSVQNFLKLCTLTTPIFHYHLYANSNTSHTIPTFRKDTKLASEELIREMWKDFKGWKSN